MADNPVGVAEAVRRAREIAAKMLPAAGININGGDDSGSRKRPLDEGDSGPQMKKSSMDGGASAQSIAQAALAKVGAQFGFNQMISVEIKIPNRLVGLVIGRQGEMINKLQAESAARIQVAPDGSEVNGLRSVSICGTPETVERAKVLVNGVVEDAGGATSLPTTVEPGQDVIEVMVPASKVGLVIGKGGEMIKTLQESAGCKMQMIQDGNFANAPDKPLRVTGSSESVKRARELVLQLIEQKDLEDKTVFKFHPPGFTFHGTAPLARGQGMPQTTQINVPKALVGFVIGRNGEHINNIQSTCGVRLQFQNDVPGSEYRVATISGNPDACTRAQNMVMDIVAEVSNKGNNAPVKQNEGGWHGGHSQQILYDHPQGGGFKPHIELPNPTGPGVTTVQFPVPAQKCGLIIGKGGDTIRQLQVQCGAHIELHRGTHPNPHEKLFNIRGSPQEITLAQQLLNDKIEGGSTPTGYPGQQTPGFPATGAQMFNPQAPGGPYAQYPYQQAYVAATASAGVQQPPQQPQPQQQQQQPAQQEQQQQPQQTSDPSHQAAWAAYYQQLYAAQAQAQAGQQAGSPAPQSQPQAGQAGDLQAQWADYYRSLGYAYYGQQGGTPGQTPAQAQTQTQPAAQPPVTTANGEQK